MNHSALLYVIPRHSYFTGWGYAVFQRLLSNGFVSEPATVAAANGFESIDQAMAAGNSEKDQIEAERIEADKARNVDKSERWHFMNDAGALRIQMEMQTRRQFGGV